MQWEERGYVDKFRRTGGDRHRREPGARSGGRRLARTVGNLPETEDLSRYQMPATSLDELRAIGELRRNRQGG